MTTTLRPTEVMAENYLSPRASGDVRIEMIAVSEQEARLANLRSAIGAFGGGTHIKAGTYTGLYRRGTLWMSNTPDEQRDHWEPIFQAQHLGAQTALVSGLGLGMVCLGLAAAGVRQLDVVEIDPDVTRLVAPQLELRLKEFNATLTVYAGDAHTITWPTGTHWDLAWHDIWSESSQDNLEDMARLHRRYGRRTYWQSSWRREQLHYERRRSGGWM